MVVNILCIAIAINVAMKVGMMTTIAIMNDYTLLIMTQKQQEFIAKIMRYEMTDKERIIIDCVDIMECDYYYVEQETDQVKCDEFSGYCREHKNCYFKQLARKTQECEELKEKYKWYDHYKDSALLNKKLCDKASDERARYRKALEKIENLISNDAFIKCPIYDDENCNYKTSRKILDIISKAKGEGK